MSRRPIRRLLAILSAAAVLPAVASPAARAAGTNLTGQRAPEIQINSGLHGLSSGATLASFSGKVVCIKFWFPGCPTCRASLPEFQGLYDAYSPRGVQFVAIAFADASSVSQFVDSNGYTFPVGVDPSGVTPGRYGVVTYPTNYVVGADGYVKAYDDLSAWVIDRELRAAAPVVSPRERNLAELGDVPAALQAVKAAAAENDYGQVARIVREHMDPAKDGAAVVEASKRIEIIAHRRWWNRTERIRLRWVAGERSGVPAEVARLAADFHGTKFEQMTRDWGVQFSVSSGSSGSASAAVAVAAPR